ncbi:MAG: sodium:proton antiporter, partial [Thermodesulfovibrionia bacterium]|nr:sodium:proton antiporter [Thermodesulfovibrionia bacterium]
FITVLVLWTLALVVPFLIVYKWLALHEILHIILADYIPFILLLTALYTVSGGILLKGTLLGTPVVNTGILLIGTVLASWMGTTGAAMLLIRPFLRANSGRKNRTFMVVFFIFLVANIGGSLTPLGDPPLFLGFLRGVPFFWTFNIFPHMLMTALILLVFYYVVDTYFYRREGVYPLTAGVDKEPLGLEGTHNFLLLAVVVGAVLMSGVVKWGEINILNIHRGTQDVIRDAILILVIVLSLLTTKSEVHEENGFTWFPMKEVAILFAGIFLTIVPCIKILQAGTKGELAFMIKMVKEPLHYFWITGILSSILDNAPTYLTFLNTLLGKYYPGIPEAEAVGLLIKENAVYLKAISAGAVFFGANSYIGNAPNFMVRSIAEETGTSMPSFFGYMLKYSIPILVPVFILVTFIFFM